MKRRRKKRKKMIEFLFDLPTGLLDKKPRSISTFCLGDLFIILLNELINSGL
jgi:hypothetical protein